MGDRTLKDILKGQQKEFRFIVPGVTSKDGDLQVSMTMLLEPNEFNKKKFEMTYLDSEFREVGKPLEDGARFKFDRVELDSLTKKQLAAIQSYIRNSNVSSTDSVVLTPKQRADLSAAIGAEYAKLKEADAKLKRFKELPTTQ